MRIPVLVEPDYGKPPEKNTNWRCWMRRRKKASTGTGFSAANGDWRC